MGDIATAAGVSRPALYVLFPGKDEVFAAVVRRMDDQWYAAVDAALPDHPTLAGRLHFVCGRWGSHGFDLAEVHPDAKDLFDLEFAVVGEVFDRFQAFVAGLIAGAVAASGVDATAAELARGLVFAMRGFLETASDGTDMRRLIAVQVTLLVAALTPARTH